MKIADRALSLLLLVGGGLHSYGSVAGYDLGSEILVWSLAGSLAIFLTATLNLLRTFRSGDRVLACLSLAASLGVLAIALGFGHAIGDVADPRALWHALCGIGLACFSLRAALSG